MIHPRKKEMIARLFAIASNETGIIDSKASLQALEILLERGWGKPIQPLQHAGPDGEALQMGGGGVYIYNSIEAAQSAAAAERAAHIEGGDRETTALFLPSNGFEIDTNAPPTDEPDDEPAPDRRALASEPNDDDEPDREPAAAPARESGHGRQRLP